MKKTIITLLALAGVATADSNPVEYDAYILKNGDTSNKITQLTGSRGQIWFNQDSASLTSWMLEFTLDDLTKGNNTLFATNYNGKTGTEEFRGGLGVYSWYDQSGVTIGKDNSHYSGAANIIIPTKESSKKFPITLRFAYNAEANTAYLYCVETGQLTSVKTDTDYILQGSIVGGASDVANLGTFWTDGGADDFTIKTVTDMSAIEGDTPGFISYVKTKTIPEPTTATLSLLALAGLAARRRRK